MAVKAAYDLELYREALQQLAVAMDQLDQADAILRDINLAWIASDGRGSQYGLSVSKLHSRLESIVANLEQLDCDECGRAIRNHPHADCKEWQ